MTIKGKASIRVLIAGAGPAGLLAAQALSKQGYRCTVFEQDAFTGARARDWNFGIYWAQDPLKDCLPDKLIDKIVNEAQVDSRPMSAESVFPIYHSVTGKLLKDIPVPMQIRLHRLNFLKILAADVDVKYNKRIRSVESDGQIVTVSFEDGTTEKGDLLIGAEGAHSKVREFLVGPDKAVLKQTPLVASFTIAKIPAEMAHLAYDAHPRMYAHLHPNGTMVISCVHDAWEGTKPGEWQYIFLISRPEDDKYDASALRGPAILQDMKARADAFSDSFKSILLSIPDDTKCWHNRLSYWIPEPWDNRNGTVTLIGDACHPMTYHRGQGLNNSVLDVATLAREIAAKGILRHSTNGENSGIDAYEKEMWVRGKEAVTASLENSLALHDWDAIMKSHLFVSGAKQQVVRGQD